jgi:hypothetical protein
MSEGNGIMNALIQFARNASPYLAVELLLPGGSVIALLLWLFRHRSKKGAGPLGMDVMRTIGLLGRTQT